MCPDTVLRYKFDTLATDKFTGSAGRNADRLFRHAGMAAMAADGYTVIVNHGPSQVAGKG